MLTSRGMKYWVCWCLVWGAGVQAQTVLPPDMLVSLGLEGYHPGFQDVFSPGQNAALLARARTGWALYSEKRFLVRELNSMVMAGSLRHHQHSGTGLEFFYMGNGSFQSVQAGITHGRTLGAVDIGVGLQYTSIAAAGYGHDGTVHSVLAIAWPVTDHIYTGLQLSNFLGGSFRKRPGERLARIASWGIGYALSPQLALVFLMQKCESRPVSFTGALSYRLPGQWQVRAGFDSGRQVPWISAGWQKKRLQVIVSIAVHARLGITPGLQLQVQQTPP